MFVNKTNAMISDLIKKCRSYRRFYEDVAISRNELLEMVDNARLSASARNAQSLKYYISSDFEINKRIFPCLAWAAYLKDWPGPAEGERPAGYIVILGDTEISKNFGCDHGIAAQSILLGARAQGLGGCMLGSIQRDRLRELLRIPQKLDILLVLGVTLGVPYFVVSSTGPLIQAWFGLAHPGKSPYRLYALSNAGSLLALISYPFFFETTFTRRTQATLWACGLVLYAASCAICGWKLWKLAAEEQRLRLESGLSPASSNVVGWRDKLLWLLLEWKELPLE